MLCYYVTIDQLTTTIALPESVVSTCNINNSLIRGITSFKTAHSASLRYFRSIISLNINSFVELGEGVGEITLFKCQICETLWFCKGMPNVNACKK